MRNAILTGNTVAIGLLPTFLLLLLSPVLFSSTLGAVVFVFLVTIVGAVTTGVSSLFTADLRGAILS
ncbi:hypothetical protein [Wolbachia pipientis]|uniref:hypothetical protein n=1 Tax=Wolbachia pipientis TaxID=955 RepID=UPI0015FB294E|nr:hypothetical protein [Wolbachia pipientis]MBA8757008.1 hypothetical protein [Wolbachia pipientis]